MYMSLTKSLEASSRFSIAEESHGLPNDHISGQSLGLFESILESLLLIRSHHLKHGDHVLAQHLKLVPHTMRVQDSVKRCFFTVRQELADHLHVRREEAVACCLLNGHVQRTCNVPHDQLGNKAPYRNLLACYERLQNCIYVFMYACSTVVSTSLCR